ncbi:MAG: hypothetical protein ACF8PG_06205 [Maioricimonas sp. JB045]|uniref:hypothetical protein n=1 Tax=Maioricimonas sp. JC845 TaxID=3232138 RepID=UPI00345ACA78
MIDRLTFAVQTQLRWYQNYLADSWRNLTPMGYGCMLIGIAVFGWILMKGASRR